MRARGGAGRRRLDRAAGPDLGAIPGPPPRPLPPLPALTRRGPRPHWRDERYPARRGCRAAEQPRILSRIAALRQDLRALPTDSRSYGLIHADLETENFFVHNDRIIAFDFDDLVFSWYAYDVAVILRQATWGLARGRTATRSELAAFLRDFMNGYERETHLGEFWLQELPLLIKLRELVSYVHLHTKWDVAGLDGETQAFDRAQRRRIEDGVPLIDFDLTRL